MLDYLRNYNSRRITGSSILMLVDNIANSYDMKIIDLSSVVYYDNLEHRDEGYITGVENILNILN